MDVGISPFESCGKIRGIDRVGRDASGSGDWMEVVRKDAAAVL